MSEKIIITFPDGNKKEVEKGISGLELASQISKSLAKESVAIKINNEIKDISSPLQDLFCRTCAAGLALMDMTARSGFLNPHCKSCTATPTLPYLYC